MRMNLLIYKTNISTNDDRYFVITLFNYFFNHGFQHTEISIENGLLSIYNYNDYFDTKQLEEIISICGFQYEIDK